MCHRLVYDALSQLHTRLLFNYNDNYVLTALCWCWLNIWNDIVSADNEQPVRWCLCIFEFECVITYFAYDELWHHHNCTLACYANTLQWRQLTTVCRYWCWLNIWRGILLALTKQEVRWYWCMFQFECVIVWYIMQHETIIIEYSSAINYNGNDTALH